MGFIFARGISAKNTNIPPHEFPRLEYYITDSQIVSKGD